MLSRLMLPRSFARAWLLSIQLPSFGGTRQGKSRRLSSVRASCAVNASALNIVREGVPLPAFKSPPPKPAQPPPADTTCRMRLIAYKPYMPSRLWGLAEQAPKRFVEAWTRDVLPVALHGSVKDVWSFSTEKRAGSLAMVCVLRVKAADVISLLSTSGLQGMFLEPVAGHSAFPQACVQWHSPGPAEEWEALRARLLESKPALGLVLGARQIGCRALRQTGDKVQRSWHLANTPPEWSDDYIKDLVQSQAQLTDISGLRRKVRNSKCSWWFRASSASDDDVYRLLVQSTPESLTEYWLLPSTTRAVVRGSKPVHDAKPFHFQRDAFSIVEKPAPQGPSAESSGPDGRPESQAKRAASTASFREVPPGVSLRKVADDGGCVFHSIVAGLKSACGKEVSSVQARAETIAHLRKYQSAYVPFFSGDGPGGETGLDFESYLKLMSQPTAWAGGLEAKACAAHFKITLVIVPQDASVPAFALNPKPGLPRIALWFSGEGPSAYYDWLEPSAKDGFPPALADVVREGRPEDVRRVVPMRLLAVRHRAGALSLRPVLASSALRGRAFLEALPSSAPTEAREAAAPATPDLSDPLTPPRPRFDKRGRMLKPLRKGFAWKCDFCDFRTVKFRARWHHLSTWHADMRESRGRKVAQVKWAGVDEQDLSAFAWRCPFCSQGSSRIPSSQVISCCVPGASIALKCIPRRRLAGFSWSRPARAMPREPHRPKRLPLLHDACLTSSRASRGIMRWRLCAFPALAS